MSKRNGALIFIFITVALDMIAMGIVIPVFPKLLLGFLGNDAARAAWTLGIFGAVFALMQFYFAPVLGLISDRIGRRPVILISNFGTALNYIIMALAPGAGWLFLGYAISGITTSSVATAYAYIADITPQEQRAGAFGKIGAAFGLGFILGPAIGGLLGYSNVRLPFWVAAAVGIANVVYGVLILPESLPIARRSVTIAWSRANPLGALKLLRSHVELWRLAIILFLLYVAHEVLPWVFSLYVIHRYAWNARSIGLSLTLVGVCAIIVSGGLVQPVVKKLGERRTLIAGLACGAIGFFLFGAAPTGAIFLLAIPIMNLFNVNGPAAQSLMSFRVTESEQGELQGALGSLRGIAMMIGPLLFGGIYSLFIARERDWHIPGAPWFLAAMLLVGAMILAFQVSRERVPLGAALPAIAEL
ncbi:MAG: TCR/Tet family MFS transporter [Candidatus Eremiobacteraeota bacterium]|nr:TCR/Tet family MFS transporter [Candidatus Eremiobacteraeota bacterium]